VTVEELEERVALRSSAIAHEAAHAAAFVLGGIVPTACYVQQRETTVSGRVGLPLLDLDDPEQARAVFVGIAAGPAVAEGRIPDWPLLDGKGNEDEAHLRELADILKLDRRSFEQLEDEVSGLVGSAEFDRLRKRFTAALERNSEDLDEGDIRLIVAQERGHAMQHMQLKADTTVQELGTFEALAAAYSIDRQGERIRPGAFAATIERWRESGKMLPLHWDHNRDASAVIGSIDPATMRERSDGLYVEGSLDIEDSEVAREAWRSLKRNRIGLSFGYLVLEQHEDDGVKVLDALDIFEVTLTPSPANADTRVLATKSAGVDDDEDAFGRMINEAFKPWDFTLAGRQSDGEAEPKTKRAVTRDSRPVQVASFKA
jgi:HK97 family phage prohead protease